MNKTGCIPKDAPGFSRKVRNLCSISRRTRMSGVKISFFPLYVLFIAAKIRYATFRREKYIWIKNALEAF